MDRELQETIGTAWESRRRCEIAFANAVKNIEESRAVLARAGDAFLVGSSISERVEFNFAVAWHAAADPQLDLFLACLNPS